MSGSLDYSRFANIGAEEAAQDSAAKSADVQAFKHAVAEAKKAHGAGSDSGEDSEDDEEAFDNPLFWKKLPSQRRHASPRALELEEMFQRMVYEERNADALALDFRERGNHAFKQSQLSEALSLYDEALEWARQMQDSQAQSGEAAVILSNRAQVHLKLGNNRTALRDARAALHLSPGSVKARFRAATAALALNRPDEAVSLCAGEQDPGAKPKLDPLRDKALALKKQAEARARAMERARYEAKRADDAVRKLYRSRPGIKVGRLNMDIRPYTQMEGTPAPVLLLPGASLAWPMLFMYPEHSQSPFGLCPARFSP
jgi:tetratricopeptide (TPR) repeat protein